MMVMRVMRDRYFWIVVCIGTVVNSSRALTPRGGLLSYLGYIDDKLSPRIAKRSSYDPSVRLHAAAAIGIREERPRLRTGGIL